MKLLVLFSFFAYVACHPHQRQQNYHNITEIIEEFGYPVQNYTVKTSDGFYLDLFRIPYGKSRGESRNKSLRKDKEVVLLMHGLMSSADEFVIGGPEESLAFILAENGYDVYIGNFRGSFYGSMHTTLSQQRDPAYWNFDFHTLAMKDLPAIFDKVIEVSGQEYMRYIGHAEGSMVFFMMTAEMPEYAKKVTEMVALGPVAYMEHTDNKIIRKIANNIDSQSWIKKNVGMNQFNPSEELMAEAQEDCTSKGHYEKLCTNSYFLVRGCEDQYYNRTTIDKVLNWLPAGASVKQFLYMAYNYHFGGFSKFDENWTKKGEYDLSQVQVPVSMIYTPRDYTEKTDDVERLLGKLPIVKEKTMISAMDNYVDLLYGKNVKEVVYESILQTFKSSKNAL